MICLFSPDCFYLQNASVVDNTILKTQIHQNRKRVHRQSLEKTGDVGKAEEGGERDGKGALQGR